MPRARRPAGRRPKGQGSVTSYVTPSGATKWRVVWDEPTASGRRQVKKAGFATQKEAERFLRKTFVAVDEGTYVPRSSLTLREYLVDQWLPSAKLSVEESTWVTWEHYVRGNVLPHSIADRPLQQLVAADFDRLYATLLAEGGRSGKGLASRTVANIHTTLHAALEHALDRGVVRSNPAAKAKKPSKRSMPRPTWEAADLQQFWSVASGHRLFAAFVLAGTTGMRRGEICGLRWDAIDLDAGSVEVVQAVAQAGTNRYVKGPKTATGYRTIHVDEVVVEVLREHQTRQAAEAELAGDLWQGSGYVFTTELGELLRPDRLTKVFDHLRAKTDLPRITLHDLRHTFATLALADGANLKALAEYLGHSETMLLTRYAHVVRGGHQALGLRMGELVSPKAPPSS